jgi:hypothetical protein
MPLGELNRARLSTWPGVRTLAEAERDQTCVGSVSLGLFADGRLSAFCQSANASVPYPELR